MTNSMKQESRKFTNELSIFMAGIFIFSIFYSVIYNINSMPISIMHSTDLHGFSLAEIAILVSSIICFANGLVVAKYGYHLFWYKKENMMVVPMLLLLMTIAIPYAIPIMISKYRESTWNTTLNEEIFLYLQKFADENYATLLMLDTSKNLNNEFLTSTEARTACVLTWNPQQIKIYGYGKEFEKIYYTGVAMHEFGHCLDLKSDKISLNSIKLLSIPPVISQKIKSVNQIKLEDEKFETAIWREALADIFAIGYWRVNYPKMANALTKVLYKDRAARISDHHTTCWIKIAEKVTPPVNNKDIFNWATKIRSSATCSLRPREGDSAI